MRERTRQSSDLRRQAQPDARLATKADRLRLIDILTTAFAADPMVEHITGVESGCDASRRAIFTAEVDRYLAFEKTFVSGNGQGAATWAHSSERRYPWWEQPAALLGCVRFSGVRGIPRALAAYRAAEEHHPAEGHYYLASIGVWPGSHGSGAGSQLVNSMLRRTDAEGIPTYLECSKPENVRFYERLGYHTVSRFSFGPGGPPVAGMWRSA
ncbi:GNAT family N-acetyltransferase [Candidatus Nanopelagicales bacterium]|nr:GNAT family N-acetyltransferase [Candidatus Nanopelagicales bacterium]